MRTQTSTKDNINRFVEFRQVVYTRIFQERRDAPFDTLDALLYVYQPSSDVDGGHITVGYPYSLLDTSWSLPLDVRRIASEQTAQDVDVAQIQALAEARQDCLASLDIVPADGKYGNGRFLSRVSGLRVGLVTRLRSDRVFYRPTEPTPGKRGRTAKWSKRAILLPKPLEIRLIRCCSHPAPSDRVKWFV